MAQYIILILLPLALVMFALLVLGRWVWEHVVKSNRTRKSRPK